MDDLSDYGTWGTNASEEALMAIAASAENESMLRGINIQAGVAETVHDFVELSQGLYDGTIEHEEQPAAVYLINAENVFEYFENGTVTFRWDSEADAGVIVE